MTKFRSQERHRPELEMGIFDKVYNSFSVDFWLIAANLVVVTNWFMHPQSLGAISLLAVGLGLVIFAAIVTDRRAQQLLRQFKRDYRTSGLLTLILGLVVASISHWHLCAFATTVGARRCTTVPINITRRFACPGRVSRSPAGVSGLCHRTASRRLPARGE